jgi:hypothetical protein
MMFQISLEGMSEFREFGLPREQAEFVYGIGCFRPVLVGSVLDVTRLARTLCE